MKKVISIALALLMVAVMLPVMAMADETATTATELPAADSNGVITLTENVTLSSFAKIEGKIKLDLNGHTITCTKNWAIVVVQYGTLTVVDSSAAGTGAIVCASGDESSRSAIYGGDNTAIIIEGGHLKGVDFGIVLMGIDSSLTVNGGVIEGEQGFGISGNGSMKNGVPECGPTTITINGGEIKGGDVGIYHPQVGKLTINNGEITGKTGVEIRAGELIVNGGTITATGDPTSTDPNGNGSTTVGAAIAVVQHTTKQPINVKINGGSFNGVSALYEANPQNNPEDATKQVGIVVDGGTFNGDVNKDDVDASKLLINGGTFTKKESGAEKYLANGKELDSNGKVVNTSITIIVPGDGGNTTTTPSTDKTKNPGTGANDFVGVAAAMAVVSLLGAAAVIRKK